MAQLIIGHTTPTTTKIWIRGNRNQLQATLSLHTEGLPALVKESIPLNPIQFNTAVVEFQGLRPRTTYQINLQFNEGDPVRGELKTYADDDREFTFLLASCHFSGGADHNSPEYGHIDAIARETNSRFIMNCGDQMYIDTAVFPFWVVSDQQYADRYIETWHSPQIRKVFGRLPQYMILDDHEIYNDFSNHGLSQKKRKMFRWAMNAYHAFQHSHNPNNFDKIYYSFDHALASFFVVDVRTERTESQMISPEQLQRLLTWIRDEHTAHQVKVIVSPVPFITQLDKHTQKDKWSGPKFKNQRDQILNALFDSPCQRFLLLSGDIHLAVHTAINEVQGASGKKIHELISSPVKQVQASLLSGRKINFLQAGDRSYAYQVGNRMGSPARPGKDRIALQNNVMTITLNDEGATYRVFSLATGRPIEGFEDNCPFV